MVFNWFRRQFSDKSEQAQEQSETAPAQSQETSTESASESTAGEEESPAVAEDYLTWAKAAYKNIQKQQQHDSEPATVEEEVEAPAQVEAAVTTPEVTEISEEAEITPQSALEIETAATPEAEIEPVAVAESAAEPETEPVVTLESTAPAEIEPVAVVETPDLNQPEPVEVVENPVEQATLTETTEETETAEPAAPVPFWAQAEADRQSRMERLKATAVEAPEPETLKPAATASVTPEVGEEFIDLAFDEGFIWSAEILAAQGRRPDDISIEEITWLKKLRQGLDKTRRNLINQLKSIVGAGPLNQAGVMEIESLLLQADVGVEATDYIITSLQNKLRQEALPPEQAIAYLKQILREMLDRPTGKSFNLSFAPEKEQLNIWLMTGVNGAGKTTTIGKIAHIADKSGYKCLIAAADTFRAAAVQQVKIWGERSGVEVIANPGQNTDPAAVVFDAIAAASARGTELLLVDTAGRLQNKKNLMEELSKIRRIIDKKAPTAKIESLLVLDATLGQNGLRQAEVFAEAAQLTGVVLTKLDGSAKGGIALAVVQQLGLPIRFIGAGEGVEDLRPFSSYEFVEALLSG